MKSRISTECTIHVFFFAPHGLMAWNRESLVFVFSSKVSGFWDFIPADTLMKFQVLNHVIFLVWPLFFLWPYGKLVSNWTFPDIFCKNKSCLHTISFKPIRFSCFSVNVQLSCPASCWSKDQGGFSSISVPASYGCINTDEESCGYRAAFEQRNK